MPYINEEARKELDLVSLDSVGAMIETTGELNYAITTIITDFLAEAGVTYGSINAVVGVLECAKLELYRRLAVPYENVKQMENGDVLFYEDKANELDDQWSDLVDAEIEAGR